MTEHFPPPSGTAILPWLATDIHDETDTPVIPDITKEEIDIMSTLRNIPTVTVRSDIQQECALAMEEVLVSDGLTREEIDQLFTQIRERTDLNDFPHATPERLEITVTFHVTMVKTIESWEYDPEEVDLDDDDEVIEEFFRTDAKTLEEYGDVESYNVEVEVQ